MNVFFHIGYPRTGSTFIQQNFFEKYNKINYLGPKRYDPSLNLYLTDKKMNEINLLDINNDMNLNNSNKLFGDLKLSEEKINVISSEKFLSFEINYLHNLFKIKELLKLQNKNINFKVFFVIRNQFEIMESYYYRAYAVISKKFKVKNFKELTELPKSNLFNNSQEEKFFNNYRYEKTFKDLNTHFHKRDISVLLYEDLNNNKVKFLKQLALIFNIDPINLIQFLNVERINDLKKKMIK